MAFRPDAVLGVPVADSALCARPLSRTLTCLDLGGSYLMIETGGVRVEIRREPWGTVGDFVDPDGNRCALRDEDSFLPALC